MKTLARTAQRCPEPECCYHGQASASSCACVDDDMLLCLDCAGSGEGQTDNTSCRACKGMGEVGVTA